METDANVDISEKKLLILDYSEFGWSDIISDLNIDVIFKRQKDKKILQGSHERFT
jgi:hypothetical protein